MYLPVWSWADIDNVEAEAEAVQHVVQRGYTRPAGRDRRDLAARRREHPGPPV